MEIYAEISNKRLREIEELGRELLIPSGAKMSRKQGSRGCYFEFDEDSKQEMVEFLEGNGMTWQETSEEWGFKKSKPSKRKSLFGEFIDPWEQKGKLSQKKGGFRNFTDPWSKNED
jgi:hypothetical protein